MNAEQFVYWLNGYLEMSETKTISEKQVEIIRDHLQLVLNKKTPDRNLLLERVPKAGKNLVNDLLAPICSNKTYC